MTHLLADRTNREALEVALLFWRAVRARDAGAVAELFADDADLDVPGARLRGRIVIRDCFLDVLRHPLPVIELNRPESVAGGEVRLAITLCGRRQRVRISAVFVVRDRRIVRLTAREHLAGTRRPTARW